MMGLLVFDISFNGGYVFVANGECAVACLPPKENIRRKFVADKEGRRAFHILHELSYLDAGGKLHKQVNMILNTTYCNGAAI